MPCYTINCKSRNNKPFLVIFFRFFDFFNMFTSKLIEARRKEEDSRRVVEEAARADSKLKSAAVWFEKINYWVIILGR